MSTYTEATQRAGPAGRRGVKTAEVGPARFVSEPAALGVAAFGLTTMALSFMFNRTFRREVLPVFETRSVQQDVGP